MGSSSGVNLQSDRRPFIRCHVSFLSTRLTPRPSPVSSWWVMTTSTPWSSQQHPCAGKVPFPRPAQLHLIWRAFPGRGPDRLSCFRWSYLFISSRLRRCTRPAYQRLAVPPATPWLPDILYQQSSISVPLATASCWYKESGITLKVACASVAASPHRFHWRASAFLPAAWWEREGGFKCLVTSLCNML